MKTLITGANGQVGWELQQIKPDNWETVVLSRTEMDITDSAIVASVFQKLQPDLVINTAAYTAVDKAEKEKDNAYEVNAKGAAIIAKVAKDSNTRLIHISTNFVFDGSKSQPYLPDDKTNPISVYGESKLQGEQALLTGTMGKALLLRTGWVYSSHGNNFVKTLLKLMAERDEISLIEDQIGTPTWARGLAKAIYHFANIPDAHGIYHWTDAGVASWYDFAVAIQEEAHHLGMIQNLIPIIPIRAEDYPTPAKRPPYSVLDKTATWETLGYTASHWRTSLRIMLKELKEKEYA